MLQCILGKKWRSARYYAVRHFSVVEQAHVQWETVDFPGTLRIATILSWLS